MSSSISPRPSKPSRGGTTHKQHLAKAIDYQAKVVEKSRRLPRIQEVADHVGVSRGTLFRWPEFRACRRKIVGACRNIADRKRLENRGSRRDTCKEDQAIKYQDEILQRSGRLPLIEATAKFVKVHPSTVQCWPGFMAQRRASGLDLRGGRSTGKERLAIECLKKIWTDEGRLPTIHEVCRAAGCAEETVYKWKKFQRVYKKAAKGFPKMTRRGRPRYAKEREAIALLRRIFETTGRVSALAELAERLGIREVTFRTGLFQVFKLAYSSLLNEQRSEGGAAAGNGRAFQADTQAAASRPATAKENRASGPENRTKAPPCSKRNALWLQWHEQEHMGPAAIRDRWNNWSEEQGKASCPRSPNRIGKGESGRNVVKTALREAKSRRGLAAAGPPTSF